MHKLSILVLIATKINNKGIKKSTKAKRSKKNKNRRPSKNDLVQKILINLNR